MKFDFYPAHIKDGLIQSVKEHCLNTAQYAGEALKPIGLYNTGYIAGLLHDLGKCKIEFKDYICNASEGKRVCKGSVNHTFAGTKFLLSNYKNEEFYNNLTIELIAYAIGAHHGLFDLINEDGRNGFDYRISDESIRYEESVSNFTSQCFSRDTISYYINNAVTEITSFSKGITDLVYSDIGEGSNTNDNEQDLEDDKANEIYFMLSLLTRMILSAVIEGDRRDTAQFMTQTVLMNNTPQKSPQQISIWDVPLKHMEEKLKALPKDTGIQVIRQKISDDCRKAAELESGIYRLNIPTGSGKTLSSLRYALAHAKKYNKSRILFISPLLSILDQNAKVIKDYIGNDVLILEHHSNVLREFDSYENAILEENWSAPIIITTLVQFLNTLFSGKTSCIRRFMSLNNSVIVIDEVQSVPTKMLSLFNMAISFISQLCGACVVLCSATQPCFEKTNHKLLGEIRDIIPYNDEYWRCFKRTGIEYIRQAVIKDVPQIARDLLKEHNSLLIICNKKAEAEEFFRILSSNFEKSFHLSADMCQEHRRETLTELYQALNTVKETNQRVLCVSTQIIEAGVDISFSSVIRIAAGMDSAVQAAGRCNRNGESEKQLPVYIVNCQDETLHYLKEIQEAKMATISLCEKFITEPADFNNDLTSNRAIEYYYQTLYNHQSRNYQDFCIDRLNLFDLLSGNEKFSKDSYNCSYVLRQAFKTAGEKFNVFENNTYDILIPYKEGKKFIEELNGDKAKYDLLYRKKILQKLKPYTVSVFSWQKKRLEEKGGIFTVCNDSAYALNEQFYDMETGVVVDPGLLEYMEV